LSEAGPGNSGNGASGGGAVAAPRLLNVANALTVARLLLVPVCVGFLAAGGTGYRYVAFAAFGVASMTDLADGELARRRNLITDFGKIADPIADKALTGSALVTLSALGELAWWITIVILARELAVTGLRFWVIRRGVIAASRGGKLKTLLQVIAISLYILPWPIPVERQVLMGAAVVVTLATGIDYTVRAIQLHRAVPHGLASGSPLSAASPGLTAGSPPPGRPGPDLEDSAIRDSAPSEADSVAPAPTGDSPGGPAGPGRGGRGSS
jgi:CDP-diacylglycerol--glycerol-3-phosphate 3-phosphatidyltransferase